MIQPGDHDVDLAAYLEAAEKASAPPWTASRDTFDRAAIKSPQHHEPLCFIYEGWEQRDSNFITLSRTAGPAAARRALAAEARETELEQKLKIAQDHMFVPVDAEIDRLHAKLEAAERERDKAISHYKKENDFNEYLRSCNHEIAQLRADLAASQALVAKLREALEAYDPPVPPRLDCETLEQYTDWLTGARKTGRRPYKEHRFRNCSLGYHEDCSDPEGKECQCPCHQFERLRGEALALTPTTLWHIKEGDQPMTPATAEALGEMCRLAAAAAEELRLRDAVVEAARDLLDCRIVERKYLEGKLADTIAALDAARGKGE